MEIERKWMVKGWPLESAALPMVREQTMRQGYISVRPTVRIREEAETGGSIDNEQSELIQNAIWEECELASTGTYTGRGFPKMSGAERADLARRGEEWTLLFQFGSILDGEDEVMFGDLGSIFFCIRKEDLAARKFDDVWLILQC